MHVNKLNCCYLALVKRSSIFAFYASSLNRTDAHRF